MRHLILCSLVLTASLAGCDDTWRPDNTSASGESVVLDTHGTLMVHITGATPGELRGSHLRIDGIGGRPLFEGDAGFAAEFSVGLKVSPAVEGFTVTLTRPDGIEQQTWVAIEGGEATFDVGAS